MPDPRSEVHPVGEQERNRHGRPQIDSLTGLRIFAAVIVYISHVGMPLGAPDIVKTFMQSGYSGVTLFFVLSGFVLTLNYFDDFRRPTGRKLWQFAVARFARIYPLYLLVLLYAIVGLRVAGQPTGEWPAHVFALQAWNSSGLFANALNGPGWSISVEFFLYACFPLVVLALARIRRVRTLLIVAAGTVLVMVAVAWWFTVGADGVISTGPSSSHRWLYRSPLGRLGDFVLGVLAARLFVEGWRVARPTRRQRGAVALMAPLSALAFLAVMAYEPTLYSAWSWDVLYAVPAVLLIFSLAAMPQAGLGRFLARPTMVRLGEASYAFYLIHMLLQKQLGAGLMSRQMSVLTIVYEVMIFGVILAVAVGLHEMVERPARRRIRRFAGDRRRPRPEPSPEPVTPDADQSSVDPAVAGSR